MINAVLAVNAAAEEQAMEADRRRRAGTSLGLMDGIPVLLKDNIDAVGLATTVGSRALLGVQPTSDAALVRRLRSTGAVILGKANLSEWNNFRSWRGTSGWSGVGGQTHNPYVLDRNPGGSSAGSAAAVAASLAQVCIGTETDGSLLLPAGLTGTVAHKPTRGLVSTRGVMVISRHQDTAGPIARHVVDVAATLDALRRPHDRAPTSPTPPRDRKDHPGLITAIGGRPTGHRIGVWRLGGCVPEVDAVTESAVREFRSLGVDVVDVDLPLQHEIGEHEFPALIPEFRHELSEFLKGRSDGPRTPQDLIDFNESDPVELSRFGQEILELAVTVDGREQAAHRAAAIDMARRSIDETLAAHHLDAIIAPTNGPAWVTDYAVGDVSPIASSSPAAVAGYPSITVPAGSVGDLPIGISIFAAQHADALVLSLAHAFERAVQARRQPRYLTTTGGRPSWNAATARATMLPI
jgi:amidase